jgi:hypothetical protein
MTSNLESSRTGNLETLAIREQTNTVLICQIIIRLSTWKPKTSNSRWLVIWKVIFRDHCNLGNASNSKVKDCSSNLPNYYSFVNLENQTLVIRDDY